MALIRLKVAEKQFLRTAEDDGRYDTSSAENDPSNILRQCRLNSRYMVAIHRQTRLHYLSSSPRGYKGNDVHNCSQSNSPVHVIGKEIISIEVGKFAATIDGSTNDAASVSIYLAVGVVYDRKDLRF